MSYMESYLKVYKDFSKNKNKISENNEESEENKECEDLDNNNQESHIENTVNDDLSAENFYENRLDDLSHIERDLSNLIEINEMDDESRNSNKFQKNISEVFKEKVNPGIITSVKPKVIETNLNLNKNLEPKLNLNEKLLNEIKGNIPPEEREEVKMKDKEKSVSILQNYFNINNNINKNKQTQNKIQENEKIETIQKTDPIKDLFNSKLDELNIEVNKLRKQNDFNNKIKGLCEKEERKLNEEIKFSNEKLESEKKKFEEWKQSEVQKLLKEKKLHENILKDLKNLPTKKERLMIESLQEQIHKINQENLKKDNNFKLVSERLKLSIEQAKNKIQSLTKEIQFMEEELKKDKQVKKDQPEIEKKKNLINQEIKQDLKTKISSKNEFEIVYPKKYQIDKETVVFETEKDGKILKQYANGMKETIFQNGVKYEFIDGYKIIFYHNNNIKQIYPDGRTFLYFEQEKITMINFPDKSVILNHHSENRVEKIFPDKTRINLEVHNE